MGKLGKTKHTDTRCTVCDADRSSGRWRLAKSLEVADTGYVCVKCAKAIAKKKKGIVPKKLGRKPIDQSHRSCASCGGGDKHNKWVTAKSLGLADEGYACQKCQAKVYYHKNKKLKNNKVDHTHTKCIQCLGVTKPWTVAATIGIGSTSEYACSRCASKIRHDQKKETINAGRRQRHHEDPDYRAKNNANSASWRKANPDSRKESYWENRSHELAVQKIYRDKIRKSLQEDLAKLNELRAQRNQYHRDYYHKNLLKERLRSRIASSLRRMRVLKATPLWADIDTIKDFYEKCPDGFDVDHIIPVNNPYVSGLHVLENLQYLPIDDNRLRKGNSFDFTLANDGWRIKPNKALKQTVQPKKDILVGLYQKFQDLGYETTRSLGDDEFTPDLVLTYNSQVLVLYIDPLKRTVQRDYSSLQSKWREKGFGCKIFYLDEYLEKEHLILSNIESYFGKTERIFARKCEIRSVIYREASSFLEANHLMGSAKARCFGLYHDDRLVACMTLKRERKVMHISRFCSLAGVTVIGGFSKLVNHVFSSDPFLDAIESFVDLRYGDGSSYVKSGWTFQNQTQSWKWTDGISTYHRRKCTANMDRRNLTQAQHADELNWWKIHDAGQARYRKEIAFTATTASSNVRRLP